MLPKYRLQVAAIPSSVRAQLRTRYALSEGLSLYAGLAAAGVAQADVVMDLLALGTEDARLGVALLIGHPISVLPPAVPPRVPVPVATKPRTPDDRRVTQVGRNPRLPTTPAYQRFQEIRRGRTVAQLLARGVTRKDLRELTGSGVVVLEVLP